jgi:hypothetical protein
MENNVRYALNYKPVAEGKVVRANGRAAQKAPCICELGAAHAIAVNTTAVNRLMSGL